MNSLADTLSTILQVPGEILGNIALMVPISMAKGIFILYYLTIITWVITLPKEETVFEPSFLKKEVNLKPFAIAALSFMIVIYLYF